MRIISQDGMIDVAYDLGNLNIGVGRFDDVERASIFFHSCSCNATKLAEYKSAEKARKAMEMLRKAFENYDWIKTTGNSDELKRFAREVSEEVFGKVTSSYFQFPADDEVEEQTLTLKCISSGSNGRRCVIGKT